MPASGQSFVSGGHRSPVLRLDEPIRDSDALRAAPPEQAQVLTRAGTGARDVLGPQQKESGKRHDYFRIVHLAPTCCGPRTTRAPPYSQRNKSRCAGSEAVAVCARFTTTTLCRLFDWKREPQANQHRHCLGSGNLRGRLCDV